MDPIIIFENLLMTGLLMCWTFEAIRLREELVERQVREAVCPIFVHLTQGWQGAETETTFVEGLCKPYLLFAGHIVEHVQIKSKPAALNECCPVLVPPVLITGRPPWLWLALL